MNYPEKVQVGENIYPVAYKLALKSTSSVRIKNGGIVIKLSRYTNDFQREEIVQKFLRWADKKLKNVRVSNILAPVFENGSRIFTHNKIYELSVSVWASLKNSKVRLKSENLIEVFLPKHLIRADERKTVKYLVEKMLMKDQVAYLKEVLDELNQLYFQEKFSRYCFKRVSSRFGSCSSKRNINIALRLLFAPREVFRYVCVHELAHLKEFNHSARFWELVASAMPDYRNCEKWLKKNGFMLG